MTKSGQPLRRLYWHLLLPATLSHALLSLMAVSFSAVRAADETSTVLSLAIGFGVGISCFLGAQFSMYALMPNLRRVAWSPEPSRSRIQSALGEVRRFGMRACIPPFLGWTLACVGVVFSGMVEGESLMKATMTYLFLLLTMGALNIALVITGTLRPTRAATAALLELGNFSMEERIAALTDRSKMSTRLAIFTLMCSLPPGMLTIDACVQPLLMELSHIARTPDAGERHEIVSELTRRIAVAGAVGGAAMATFCVLLAVYLGRGLRKPFGELTSLLDHIARGDLSHWHNSVVAEDELAGAAASIVAFHTSVSQAIGHMRRAGEDITTTTGALMEVAMNHELGAANSAASLISTVATTDDLARSARQVAETANAVAALAQNTLSAAQSGQRSSETFVQAMERTKAENQAIADAVIRLNKRVQQIGKVIEFINGVADKSDLLALNAELEGTKTGELGAGFSLVAAEMRRLSEAVLSSTSEISKLIDEVKDATHAAVMATEAGVKATDQGAELAQKVSSRLQDIVRLADETSDAVRAISLSTQQQQTGTDQLAEAMSAVLQGTEAEAQATHESVAANTDLSQLATELGDTVSGFKLARTEAK